MLWTTEPVLGVEAGESRFNSRCCGPEASWSESLQGPALRYSTRHALPHLELEELRHRRGRCGADDARVAAFNKLIVECNVPVFGTSNNCHFEAILSGDGSVVLQYLDMPAVTGSWSDESVGFEDRQAATCEPRGVGGGLEPVDGGRNSGTRRRSTVRSGANEIPLSGKIYKSRPVRGYTTTFQVVLTVT